MPGHNADYLILIGLIYCTLTVTSPEGPYMRLYAHRHR